MQATAELTHGAATVISIAQHFDRLKDRAVDLIEKIDAEERGFFTPTEDEQTRHLLISYWQSRNALFELVSSFHQVKRFKSDQQPLALMVAYAGALVLVDVARFNGENFHHRHIVRAKLNDAEVWFGFIQLLAHNMTVVKIFSHESCHVDKDQGTSVCDC